ncbi:DUF4489 domain-containing protein [Pontibacillus sp. HMF3514]|uniref:DUF4489 domain-containing protein n=1 Tax=Pontibacillus sp. HMF3514 TaxID=2692425 RepID=UPI00131FD72E|nr:DUF4489 domain-containing protein [Pontibacillus sp. HMF3514]QHE51517.1 DUF4489 domain-containing protein [Pontibacillus sp. HMF3514]
MKEKTVLPTLTCGRVFREVSSSRKAPIKLAEVTVEPSNIKNSCFLINYSKNFTFQIMAENPEISITYQLVRSITNQTTLLDEWLFSGSEIIPTPVETIKTIEPLVLNFCDCLEDTVNPPITYTYQISNFTTTNTSFEILSQEISAIRISGEEQ